MRTNWFSALLAMVPLLLGTGLAFSAESGPDLFKKLECNTCHAVQSQGIEKIEEEKSALDMFAEEEEEVEPPDLSGVGAEHDAEWMTKWLRKEVKNEEDRKHKPKFEGTDEELKAVVEYVSGLTEKK